MMTRLRAVLALVRAAWCEWMRRDENTSDGWGGWY